MVFIMNGTIRYTIRPYDTIWMLAQVFNTTVDSIMQLNPGIEPTKLQIGQVITIMPGLQNYPSYTEDMDQDMDYDMDEDVIMGEFVDFFRMLWEQHTTWTRIAIMSIIHDLPETELVLQRLLRNATDFGDALRSFYGDEAAQTFENLLTQHLQIAAEIVQLAKAGDTEALAQAEQRWYENAAAIAEFLGGINPYWNVEDWNAMLDEHLQLLSNDINLMVAQDYAASIAGFDDIEAQALEMADMMAEGLSMQFPA